MTYLKRGNTFTQTEGNFETVQYLEEGIYQIVLEPMTGMPFLVKVAQKFDFGFKLYGIDEMLVTHVIDTYNKQPYKRNIGVLLNGAKGTGKTVTAKVLANKLGLPVIIVDANFKGVEKFLASINQDCIFLFDEFEKNFRMTCVDDEDCAGENLLSIMDGVYNSNSCHVFILTTNELRVNDNLLSRPSRIRYLKSFGSVIDKNVLYEYIDDNLKYPERKYEIIDFIESLELATIDIVKSIVDEVNIHNCSVESFKSIFNVKMAKYIYHSYFYRFDIREEITEKEFLKKVNMPREEYAEWRPSFTTFTCKKSVKNMNLGDQFCSNRRWIISKIDLENNFIECSDIENKNEKLFIYIENIDEKPSIYSNKYGYSGNYEYDDFFD